MDQLVWDLQDVSAWLEPYRHAWYALPIVMLVFIALAMVPVVLLIAATGVVFGPILGPLYAMAGCLASASVWLRDWSLDGPSPRRANWW